MASTDIDGTNLMMLREGQKIALVVGEKAYRGTLQMRKDGIKETWSIKLDAVAPGEPEEIQLHGLYEKDGTLTITDGTE